VQKSWREFLTFSKTHTNDSTLSPLRALREPDLAVFPRREAPSNPSVCFGHFPQVVLTSHQEEVMTIREELAKEIEDLPPETQEKVLRLIRVIKGETVMSHRRKAGAKRTNALVEVDAIAIETGIPDLASQHDHYLYGVPKR